MAGKAGQIAVVTGGNRGLGFETSRRLARLGMRVVLTSRDEAKGKEAAQRLSIEGSHVAWLPLDVTNPAGAESLAGDILQNFGSIDVLVNNAGVGTLSADGDGLSHTLEVNIYGAIRVTDTLLPLMRGRGRIVMVSSGMGALSGLSPWLRKNLGDPAITRDQLLDVLEAFEGGSSPEFPRHGRGSDAPYRVSKAALNAFTRILARELSGTDILVNAVCPGWVRTDMGGPSAPRSVEEGAAGIVWAATLPDDGPTGGIFQDGKPIPW